MKKKFSRQIVILTLGLLWAGFVQAQESTNAAGGNATGSGGTVAYSVGQVAYTTNTDNSGSTAQGVQHAFEIFIVGVKEPALNVELMAYPNPTSDNLFLQIGNFNNEKLSYQIFDTQGKLLSNGKIKFPLTQVNMNNLPSAIYFIKVVNEDNKNVQSFKIIKN